MPMSARISPAPLQRDPLIGQLIGGRYRIDRIHAQGGMSVTLVLPGPVSDALAEMARDPLERAAVLIARVHPCADGTVRLLGRDHQERGLKSAGREGRLLHARRAARYSEGLGRRLAVD